MASDMETIPREGEKFRIKVSPFAYVKLLLASLQYPSKAGENYPSEKIAGIFTGSKANKDLKILNFYYLENLGLKDFDIASFPGVLECIEKLQRKLQKETNLIEEREILAWVTSTSSTDLAPMPIHLKTQYFLQSEVSENILGAIFAPALLEESYGLAFFHLKGDYRYITEFSPVVINEYMLAAIGENDRIFDLLIDVNDRFHDKERKILLPPMGGI